MKISFQSRLNLRSVALSVAAGILTWLVITKSLAVYLADVAPQAALWLNARQPDALLTLADGAINASPTYGQDRDIKSQEGSKQVIPDNDRPANGLHAAANGSPDAGRLADDAISYPQALDEALRQFDGDKSVDLAKVRTWTETALNNDPLNARALRILGQIASADSDYARTSKFMAAAARLSLHETIAVYWMMHQSAQSGDDKTAVAYADALLRTNPVVGAYVVSLLVHFAEKKESSGLITALLENNPPWRDSFFGYLPSDMSDVRTPLNLFTALRKSAAPPGEKEIDDYLVFLIGHKFYDLAYYTWLQFLPSDQLRMAGSVFNGDFDTTPSGSPFDWTIKQGAGVTVDLVPTPGEVDGHALSIDFHYGRVEYHSVSEMVLLAPGTYQLTAQYKGKLIGPRGMKWRLICAGDSATRIGESSMISGVASSWKQVEFVFTVPTMDCRAQYLRLDLDARMASEQLVNGSMLFNQVRISHFVEPAPAQRSSN